MQGLAFYSSRTVGVVHFWKKENITKIVTSKNTPALPNYWFPPASLCTQTSASQVLCDVDYKTKSCCWKYPPLNIAGRAVSSPLDYAGCNSTVCPAQETAWSCPAAQAEQRMITASLFSLLAQRRNICSASFPGIKLLLLSLSQERDHRARIPEIT